MTQLELFDKQSEIEFALGLTTSEFVHLKKSNPEAYHWIKHIRNAVHKYNFKLERIKAELEHDLTWVI